MSDSPSTFPGYIIALTGPSGVGKSTISRLLQSVFAEHIALVPILTTRGPKDGDSGEYEYISLQEFQDLQRAGKLVASTNIASQSEERWYGYRGDDIQAIRGRGMLPVVITEMHLLQGLSDHYGRRAILSFGLLPPGRSKRMMLSALLHRLRARGRETEEQIADRLENAKTDLRFFEERKDLFNHLLVNDNLQTVLAHFTPILGPKAVSALPKM